MGSSAVSDFSLVATDAAADLQRLDATTQDPFQLMRLGEEMEEQYLSDASVRLQNPGLWAPSLQVEIRKLAAGASPEVQARLEELDCKFQEVTSRSIIALRSDLLSMTLTIWEKLQLAENETVQQQCDDQLKDVQGFAVPKCRRSLKFGCRDTMEQIMEEFRKQEEEFNTRIKKHGLSIARLSEKSRWEFTFAALRIMGALATILVTAGVGRVAYLATYRPQDLTWTNFVNNWYKPDYRDSSGKLHYKKMTREEGGIFVQAQWILSLGTLTPTVSIFTLGLLGLGTFFGLRRKMEHEVQAKAEKIVKSDLEKHKIMWQGVCMCVESVKRCFDRLSGMSAARKMQREKTIKDMAKSLWSMSMAMDEMAIWMKDRECFPPNYSVRNLVGAARHDRIQDVLMKARASQPRLQG
eukprot:Skav210020  [mRNA]  locus=scaffold1212:209322:211825:- [translate_table: standard]